MKLGFDHQKNSWRSYDHWTSTVFFIKWYNDHTIFGVKRDEASIKLGN